MNIDTSLSPVLTVRGLAGYLRVHPSTVYRLLKDGLLPAFRVGSDWRFNREDIQRWRLGQTRRSPALAGIAEADTTPGGAAAVEGRAPGASRRSAAARARK